MRIGLVGTGLMGAAHAAAWLEAGATLAGCLAETPAQASARTRPSGLRGSGFQPRLLCLRPFQTERASLPI